MTCKAVRCGVRTHAHLRVPELKSGALDRSANLTSVEYNSCSTTTAFCLQIRWCLLRNQSLVGHHFLPGLVLDQTERERREETEVYDCWGNRQLYHIPGQT